MNARVLAHDVVTRADKSARAVLGPIRARSKTFVNLPPESGIGLGNMLSFWLWAHAHRRAGNKGSTMRTPAMEPWIREFPDVEPLLIDRSDIGFFSQRATVWGQEWDTYHREDFVSFIQERILTAPRLRSLTSDSASSRSVTLNVRRGDYYSNPKWHPLYGFDIEQFVRVALEGTLAQGPVDEIRVVSDDIEWCARHLPWLGDGSRRVEWLDNSGPMDDFVELCRARRLILTNSSFSYWGGYVSSVLHGDNHSEIWVPEFHRRDINDGRAWQLDPKWSIVRDIPGGWKLAD